MSVTLLRDSGATRSFLKQSFIDGKEITRGKQVRIITPGGEPFIAEVATVCFSSPEVNVTEPVKYEFVILDGGISMDGINTVSNDNRYEWFRTIESACSANHLPIESVTIRSR